MMKVKVGKVDTIVYFDLFIYFFFIIIIIFEGFSQVLIHVSIE